jgi:hypothetical protein
MVPKQVGRDVRPGVMVLTLSTAFPDRIDLQEAAPVSLAPGRVASLTCQNLGEGNRPCSWSVPVTRFLWEGSQILPDKPLEQRAGPHRCNSTFGAAPLGNPEPAPDPDRDPHGGTGRDDLARKVQVNGPFRDQPQFVPIFIPIYV